MRDKAIEANDSRIAKNIEAVIYVPSHQQAFFDQQPFLFTDDEERSWVEFLAANGSETEVTVAVTNCSKTYVKAPEVQPITWLRNGVQKVTEEDRLIEIASSRVCASFPYVLIRTPAKHTSQGPKSCTRIVSIFRSV